MAKFRFDGDPPGICKSRLRSKYPPAKPEALRLLAPQRGLTATDERQKQRQRRQRCSTMVFVKAKATATGILPEFSKFYCHPGRAGGSPFWFRRRTEKCGRAESQPVVLVLQFIAAYPRSAGTLHNRFRIHKQGERVAYADLPRPPAARRAAVALLGACKSLIVRTSTITHPESIRSGG